MSVRVSTSAMEQVVGVLQSDLSRITIAITIGAFVTSFFYWIEKSKTPREANQKKFDKAVKNGIKSGSITSVEDLEILFLGVTGQSAQDESSCIELARWVRQFLAEELLDGNLSDEFLAWKKLASGFLTEIEERSSYVELPDAERSLMVDIESYVAANDQGNFKRKLEELQSVILLRERHVSELERSNVSSGRMSLIGLILTIAFGTASILMAWK